MNLDKEKFKRDYKKKMISMYRESLEEAGNTLKYMALGSLLMDYMANDWHNTDVKYETEKQVYYFSMEFLIGRLLDAALINLGRRGTQGTWNRTIPAGRNRTGCRSWQRRAGPSCRVLYRFHGVAWHRRDGNRNPVPVRPVRAADTKRISDRKPG